MAPSVDTCLPKILSDLSFINSKLQLLSDEFSSPHFDDSLRINLNIIKDDFFYIENSIRKFDNNFLLANPGKKLLLNYIQFLTSSLVKNLKDYPDNFRYSLSAFEYSFSQIKYALFDNNDALQYELNNQIKSYVEKKEELVGVLKEISTQLEDVRNKCNDSAVSSKLVEQYASDISSVKDEINDKYNEILKEYNYIFDEGVGENSKKEGLKKQLQSAFDETLEKFNDFKNEFQSFIEQANAEKNNVVKEIKSYLPDSVAAGLSGSYKEKKDVETKEIKKNRFSFIYVVFIMVFIESIPFIVLSSRVIEGSMSYTDFLQNIPLFSASVLPILLPLIWLGIHLNRSINLNKKLIEEYAYKEAISKTVTGVSEQIELLDDENVKKEIKEKLIKLIISAGENNPAQYINQYDKSDNPFMEFMKEGNIMSNKVKESPLIKLISLIVSEILEKQQKKDK